MITNLPTRSPLRDLLAAGLVLLVVAALWAGDVARWVVGRAGR